MRGRITPGGNLTFLKDPENVSAPEDMTASPDGSLWFTNNGKDTIGRVTPGGEITTFSAK